MDIEVVIFAFGVVAAWICVTERIRVAWFALFFWLLAFASFLLAMMPDYEVLAAIGNNIAGLLFLAYIIKVNTKKEGNIK